MRMIGAGLLAAGAMLTMTPAASAHFQMILPSTDTVTEQTPRTVGIELVFTHPMERGPVMPMERPVRFGVLAGGKVDDLEPRLQSKPVDGKRRGRRATRSTSRVTTCSSSSRSPTGSRAERKMIVHYAKVVVDAFGCGRGLGRDGRAAGRNRPLARPYGLWTGNLFRGIVARDGEPVPFAEIEVE